MLCERLRETRERLGYTQLQVREAIGVSQASYSFFESGEKIPSLAVTKKIADFFNVSIDYLCGRTDKA